MSEKCPSCDGELVELRYEKLAEQDYSSDSYFVTGDSQQFYWALYGFWCPICLKMFSRKSKTWLEEVIIQN